MTFKIYEKINTTIEINTTFFESLENEDTRYPIENRVIPSKKVLKVYVI